MKPYIVIKNGYQWVVARRARIGVQIVEGGFVSYKAAAKAAKTWNRVGA